jgi:hypothetical protein
VTSSTVCDVTFEMVRHEFQRNFYVLRDSRAAELIMGLPWFDDEHASLQFGSTRVLTLMDGTMLETQLEERRLECLLISSTKVQKLMRKTRRIRGRNAEFYVIELTPAADHQQTFTLERNYQQPNVTTSGRYFTMTSRSYYNMSTLHM